MANIVAGDGLLDYFCEMLGEDPEAISSVTITLAYGEVAYITIVRLATDVIERRFLEYEHLDKAVEILRARRP